MTHEHESVHTTCNKYTPTMEDTLWSESLVITSVGERRCRLVLGQGCEYGEAPGRAIGGKEGCVRGIRKGTESGLQVISYTVRLVVITVRAR